MPQDRASAQRHDMPKRTYFRISPHPRWVVVSGIRGIQVELVISVAFELDTMPGLPFALL